MCCWLLVVGALVYKVVEPGAVGLHASCRVLSSIIDQIFFELPDTDDRSSLTPSQTRNKINVVLHVCGYPLFLYYYVSLLLLSESCPVTNVVPVSSLSVVQRTRRVHHHHLFCIKPNSFRKRTYFKHCRHTWIELHTYISRLQLPVGPTQNQLLLKPDINDF